MHHLPQLARRRQSRLLPCRSRVILQVVGPAQAAVAFSLITWLPPSGYAIARAAFVAQFQRRVPACAAS